MHGESRQPPKDPAQMKHRRPGGRGDFSEQQPRREPPSHELLGGVDPLLPSPEVFPGFIVRLEAALDIGCPYDAIQDAECMLVYFNGFHRRYRCKEHALREIDACRKWSRCERKQTLRSTPYVRVERFARVRDPFGHEWGITTHLHDMTPTEIQAEAAKLFDRAAR